MHGSCWYVLDPLIQTTLSSMDSPFCKWSFKSIRNQMFEVKCSKRLTFVKASIKICCCWCPRKISSFRAKSAFLCVSHWEKKWQSMLPDRNKITSSFYSIKIFRHITGVRKFKYLLSLRWCTLSHINLMAGELFENIWKSVFSNPTGSEDSGSTTTF